MRCGLCSASCLVSRSTPHAHRPRHPSKHRTSRRRIWASSRLVSFNLDVTLPLPSPPSSMSLQGADKMFEFSSLVHHKGTQKRPYQATELSRVRSRVRKLSLSVNHNSLLRTPSLLCHSLTTHSSNCRFGFRVTFSCRRSNARLTRAIRCTKPAGRPTR